MVEMLSGQTPKMILLIAILLLKISYEWTLNIETTRHGRLCYILIIVMTKRHYILASFFFYGYHVLENFVLMKI